MIWGKGVYASNSATSLICGKWEVMYRKYRFESVTQEGTVIEMML